MAVHAEDHDLVQFNYERFLEEGRTDGVNLAHVHTKLSEQLSFNHTIRLAAATGAAVYFVHTSAREGVEAVARRAPAACRFTPKRCIITPASTPKTIASRAASVTTPTRR